MTLVRKVLGDRILGDRGGKKFHLEVPGEERHLGQVRDFVDRVCAELDVPPKTVNSLKLAIDEACSNIIRHAYRERKGSIQVTIAPHGPNNLLVSLVDQGESFDLNRVRVPDLRRYVATGRKGGLGLFLMNRLMDEVAYNVTSSGNVLTMKKNLSGKRKRPPLAWKKTIWHKSLRFKFSLYASVILFAIVAGGVSLFVVRHERTITRETIARGQAVAETIANQSSELLLSRVALSVEQTLLNETIAKTINESPEIASIVVADVEGNVWASNTPSQLFKPYGIVFAETHPDDTKYRRTFVPIEAPVLLRSHGTEVKELGMTYVDVRRDYIRKSVRQARATSLAFAFLVLALGNVAIWFVVALFVRPLQKLTDGVRAISEGMLDRHLEEGGPDEIDEIARTFNEITARFRKAQQTVVEQERLQKEMQVAQEIQQSLLPREVPQAEGFEIGTMYRAAKEVGGDYYDFVWVDDDTLGIVVADVSGKGVPGSLVMTMIRTALRMEARGNRSARDVVARLNSFVTEDMKKGMFVTIFYVILDSRHRIISFASAGHNPMILYRGDSDETYFLNPKGFPVGIDLADRTLFEKSIGSESIKLKQADMLVIYTDGITEAMNPEKAQFGEERLLRAIKKYGRERPQEFASRLTEEIAAFTGGEPQNDDITLVAIKEKALADDILYDMRKRLIGLVEEDGLSVEEACQIMNVSPSTYYKYRRRMRELGEEGLKEKIPRAIEKLGRVSLEVQQKILQIAMKFPGYGPKRISRLLEAPEYGCPGVPPRKVYECLRRLRLSTKKHREQFASEGGRKIMDLCVEVDGPATGTDFLGNDGGRVAELGLPADDEVNTVRQTRRTEGDIPAIETDSEEEVYSGTGPSTAREEGSK